MSRWVGCLLALGFTAWAQTTSIEPRVSVARAKVQPFTVETPPLVRIDASLVLVPARVTTPLGSSVTDLTRDKFRIFEDDVPQDIASFTAEEAPISVGLLFDSSASMQNKLDVATQSAAVFFRTANPGDEFFLVEFNSRARLVESFTSDAGLVHRQISRIRPQGQTALLDAVHFALKEMKNARNPRKAIVIISDGGDNRSRHTRREVREELIESDVQIYAMGIFDPDYIHNHPIEERNGPLLLDNLTEQTGGHHLPVANLQELPDIAARISDEIRHQYLLGYYSSNPAQDGKYRRIKVSLAVPGLRVDYRHGYYSPGR